jgi:hypothetical protein
VAAVRMITHEVVGIVAIAFDYRMGRAATDVVKLISSTLSFHVPSLFLLVISLS